MKLDRERKYVEENYTGGVGRLLMMAIEAVESGTARPHEIMVVNDISFAVND